MADQPFNLNSIVNTNIHELFPGNLKFQTELGNKTFLKCKDRHFPF